VTKTGKVYQSVIVNNQVESALAVRRRKMEAVKAVAGECLRLWRERNLKVERLPVA
jgi:hypothetical protein